MVTERSRSAELAVRCGKVFPLNESSDNWMLPCALRLRSGAALRLRSGSALRLRSGSLWDPIYLSIAILVGKSTNSNSFLPIGLATVGERSRSVRLRERATPYVFGCLFFRVIEECSYHGQI